MSNRRQPTDTMTGTELELTLLQSVKEMKAGKATPSTVQRSASAHSHHLQALFEGHRVKRWVNIERPALRKLAQLDWSAVLDDLKVPPGNGLEALKDDRKGQHSIRINQQWRVCFVWTPQGPTNVEIVDYH